MPQMTAEQAEKLFLLNKGEIIAETFKDGIVLTWSGGDIAKVSTLLMNETLQQTEGFISFKAKTIAISNDMQTAYIQRIKGDPLHGLIYAYKTYHCSPTYNEE